MSQNLECCRARSSRGFKSIIGTISILAIALSTSFGAAEGISNQYIESDIREVRLSFIGCYSKADVFGALKYLPQWNDRECVVDVAGYLSEGGRARQQQNQPGTLGGYLYFTFAVPVSELAQYFSRELSAPVRQFLLDRLLFKANSSGPTIKLIDEESILTADVTKHMMFAGLAYVVFENSHICFAKSRGLKSVSWVYQFVQDYRLLEKQVCLVQAEFVSRWNGKHLKRAYGALVDLDRWKVLKQEFENLDRVAPWEGFPHRDSDRLMQSRGFEPLEHFGSSEVLFGAEVTHFLRK